MSQDRCRRCGAAIPPDAAQCPACGTPRARHLPTALIGAFFIIGVLLGLLFIDSHYYRAMVSRLSGESEASVSTQPAATETGSVRTTAPSPQQSGPTDALTSKASSPARPSPSSGETTLVCDPELAQRVRDKALEIAELQVRDGVLHVRLRRQWEYYSAGIRRSFLQAFAESDACLEGHSRTIRFYYEGQLIAVSQSHAGLERGTPTAGD